MHVIAFTTLKCINKLNDAIQPVTKTIDMHMYIALHKLKIGQQLGYAKMLKMPG